MYKNALKMITNSFHRLQTIGGKKKSRESQFLIYQTFHYSVLTNKYMISNDKNTEYWIDCRLKFLIYCYY